MYEEEIAKIMKMHESEYLEKEVFKTGDFYGYVEYINTDEMIKNCLNKFTEWAIANKQFDFDHVELVIRDKATVGPSIGIKWHVRGDIS